MAWFALASKAKCEVRVCNNLWSQGFTCFFPEIKQIKLLRGVRTESVTSLFSSYFFIKLEEFERYFRTMSNTRGVNVFVRFGLHFAKIDEQVIEFLKQRHGSDQIIEDKSLFQPNDEVEILDGQFKYMRAFYQFNSGDERTMVLVQILQQQIKLYVDNRLLSKVG